MKVAMTKDWVNPITEWVDVINDKAAHNWVRTWAKKHNRFVKEYSRFIYTDNGRTIIDFGDYTVFGMIEGE